MAFTNDKYSHIKEIISSVDGMEVHPGRGRAFTFPVYLNSITEHTDIEVLELSVRSHHCLKRAEIHTIGDLCEKVHNLDDLKRIRNCGANSAAEIMDHLFFYQYSRLSPEGKKHFLLETAKMSLK